MEKSADAFRTISEVAEYLETPAHVLRFWESRFPQIRPVKRAGGRRYYRPADVALLAGIRQLLHDDGLTIRGVQKILREQGVRHVAGIASDDRGDADAPIWEDAAPERSKAPIQLFPKASQEAEPEDRVDLPVSAGDSLSANGSVREPVPEETSDREILAESAADEPLVEAEGEEGIFALASEGGVHPGAEPSLETAEDVRYEPEVPESSDEVGDVAEIGEDVIAVSQPESEVPAENTISEEPSISSDSDEFAAVSESEAAEPEEMATPPAPRALPEPPAADTTPAHWIASDLRAMRRGAMLGRKDQVTALVARLNALREQVADRGRVPRR